MLAIVLLFESPYWITKKRTLRQMDHDNRIKPTLDVLAAALNFDDRRFWEVHAYKVASKVERTHAYLFDLGDLIDYSL